MLYSKCKTAIPDVTLLAHVDTTTNRKRHPSPQKVWVAFPGVKVAWLRLCAQILLQVIAKTQLFAILPYIFSILMGISPFGAFYKAAANETAHLIDRVGRFVFLLAFERR
jgi:hypothetical protein